MDQKRWDEYLVAEHELIERAAVKGRIVLIVND